MPSIEVTESDLEKALQQIALLEENIAHFKGAPGDNSSMIAKLEADVLEIRAEARRYDVILYPGPRPSICTLCNGHPLVEMPAKPCPNCGCTLINAQPAAGKVNWIVPGEIGKAMAEGQVPA